jgi:hypothetical protein
VKVRERTAAFGESLVEGNAATCRMRAESRKGSEMLAKKLQVEWGFGLPVCETKPRCREFGRLLKAVWEAWVAGHQA